MDRERTDQPSGRQIGGGGKRLDPSRHAAILAAAIEGLAEYGYDRLTMDDIAARAHAGKGALYRRWPSKAALVVDAVVAWRATAAPFEEPDTGSLRGDVEAMIASVPDFSASGQAMMGVFLGLVTAAGRDPELARAVDAHLLSRPREVMQHVLDRARARGEIPAGRNFDLLPDILIGLNLLRMVTGHTVDRDFVRGVFDQVVMPLVTAPDDSESL